MKRQLQRAFLLPRRSGQYMAMQYERRPAIGSAIDQRQIVRPESLKIINYDGIKGAFRFATGRQQIKWICSRLQTHFALTYFRETKERDD